MKSSLPLLLILLLAACQATPSPTPTFLPTSPLPSLVPSATTSQSPRHTSTALPTHTPTLTSTALPTETATPTPSRPWRIMPLGDSLTSGTYPGRVHSYRGYLEALLDEAGYAIDFTGTQTGLAHEGTDPDHEGHSGYSIGPDQRRFCEVCSTANLYDHLEEYLSTEPDIILLLTGINDLLPWEEYPVVPEEAPGKLANLVARIQELRPQAYIFVASLPPINYMDSAELPYYDEINQMAETVGQPRLQRPPLFRRPQPQPGSNP